VEIHTRVVYSRIVECEDGHPRGWPLLFVPHAPQYGQLQVQKTGSGIPAGACARKFEPLCTTKPGGAELGLYIGSWGATEQETGVSQPSPSQNSYFQRKKAAYGGMGSYSFAKVSRKSQNLCDNFCKGVDVNY
jgi:hypothetical protein